MNLLCVYCSRICTSSEVKIIIQSFQNDNVLDIAMKVQRFRLENVKPCQYYIAGISITAVILAITIMKS